MTMQHRRNGISGDPIVIRAYANFKQDKAINERRIKISEIAMAGKRITEENPKLAAWFLLQVTGGREATVDKLLGDEDVEGLVLREEEQILVRRGRKWTVPGRPWLPGFVLVRCVPSAAAFRGLLGVAHVTGVVGGWEKPYRVPNESINQFNAMMQLKEEERERLRLEQEAKNAGIKVRDKVRIRLGPLAGFVATVLSIGKGKAKRCKVRYKCNGREGDANVALANLEAI